MEKLLENLDIVVQILKIGVIGLGFLLAFMAYKLIAKEQERPTIRRSFIWVTSIFMGFSLIISFVGIGSEYLIHRFGGIKPIPDSHVKEEESYYAVDITKWNYDSSSHNFFASIIVAPARTIQHVPEKELSEWFLYLAVRKDLKQCELEQDKYVYFSGPHNLSPLVEKKVETNEEFTKYIEKNNVPVQCAIILARKGIKLNKGFCPNDYPKDQLRVIQSASY